MRRVFWAFLGIGLGAVLGAKVVRWSQRAKGRYAPPAMARAASGKLEGIKDRLKIAIEDGLSEMVAREAEIREELSSRR